MVPCVRFNCFVQLYIVASSTVATLGMSGWLDLPQPGLPPGKKRQASLGALTQKRTSLDQRRIDWKWKLLYLLAQAGVHASGESEKGRLLAPLAEGDGRWFRNLEFPLMWVLLKTRKG